MPASAPLITTDPAADEARRRGLRRMRVVAGSLLGFAAVVYVATIHSGGALGFVNAGAEASMVGAMADWFAVTALFRAPLGLPIPHTGLIPRRKDELAKGLEEFVSGNFLHEEIIRERVAAATVTRRLGHWLADERHARRVVDELADIAAIVLARIRDEHIEALWSEALLPRFREEPVAPVLGTVLGEVVRDDLHHGLVDLALEELERWLEHNPETFTAVVAERAPWWTPEALNARVTARLYLEAVDWVRDIRSDQDHHARRALDSMLDQLSRDLLTDPDTQDRAERFKARVLEHPQMLASGISLWNGLRRALLGALREPDGPVRARLVQETTALARRLDTDTALRERLDRMLADAVVFGVSRYGEEITAVISHTIARWDGAEAARRIELHVGRDLQFIRINGTLVGGLVGLGIHTLSVSV
ncbi:DUF445 domain-containing protein [Paraconexibacter antarcticus]|uniref:DUF445 domain-containing protein n=1 Tax=Paraconexibacter antarcticus TaxID=2949664 RepID=A0ABY5DSI7_9ACTN|nr:DUF445 domain-containing protein [Paraconexibacter antarcticus]UTI64420.1 DUF445 domain-containing protein [Paraconexibacter antarcticus]